MTVIILCLLKSGEHLILNYTMSLVRGVVTALVKHFLPVPTHEVFKCDYFESIVLLITTIFLICVLFLMM